MVGGTSRHPPDAPVADDAAETHYRRLDRFVREHQATLLRIAVRVVRSRSTAEDVV